MNSLNFIQLETTNICNAQCLFCPHHKFNKFGTMPDELYEKIVLQASELPKLERFIPMLTGEPFCDKKFMERLKFAREKLPKAVLEVYTNGSLLTREIIEELKIIPNLQISVSVNALTPETRKRIMGLDDFRAVAGSMAYMEELGIECRATMVGYPDIEVREIRDFVDAGGLCIKYQSWCGEQYAYERKRRTSCPRAMNYMTILYTGEVCLCCFDPFGKVVFGDLNNQSIEEIWTSDKHREYQGLHAQGRGQRCGLCCCCSEN